ncbi:MAG: polysaccharide biosynthesis/export family protein [Polyangiaceae bacterium]
MRADGAVMLPLVGEVLVAGKAPAAIATELEERLKPYVQAPRVTITIESSPVRVTVFGGVRTPGTTSLERPATIVQALADRGGITEFASDDRLFVLRGQARVRFTYEQLTRGDGAARSFTLLPGDVVVVE